MKSLFPKLMLLIVIVVLAFGYFQFNLGDYLTLEYFKSQQKSFELYYQDNKFQTIAIYFIIYVATTALSLPGATLLTLAGGALFGLTVGLIVISFASTIGATCAFLVSRFILRDYIQNKFGDKLVAINEGIKKDGAFYLFTLRLIPAFPFFIINLVMGLTPISVIKYYLVSQIGMLAGTVVFVNAGTQIGKLESLSGILSPALLGSFALLGIFPLIAKKSIEYVKSRRYLKKYTKPKSFDYNLIVIGAGSGGLVSALIASAVKAKVALIEKHKMGGDCLNTGCVPSKALIRSAKMLSYARRAQEFGFKSSSVEFDFPDVMERVQQVIKKIEPHDSVERFTKLGVECIQGEAKIMSPYTVEVNGNTLSTKNIIIATGGRPRVPDIPGIDQVEYRTSDTLWDIRDLPARLLVLGGGPIGCELAQSFQRFGSRVTLVQRGDTILPAEDIDASNIVKESFEKDGVHILTGHTAKYFSKEGGIQKLVCSTGENKELEVEFDLVLLALGRAANTKGFGLDDLEIQLSSNGTIENDEFLRTNYPNIYVCGDVAGPYQFTHVASHQAWYASVNALFSPLKKFKVDYRVIPRATFTDPEVARVGLNEKEAKQKSIAYEVTTYGIDDLDRAIADNEAHGLVKVLTVPGKDKILGVTIVGAHASDIIAEFVTAMKYNIGLNKILGTIHIYPTLAESNKYVAGNWKRKHAPEKLLSMLKKFHAWRRS